MSYPFSLKPIPLAQKSNNLGKPKRIPQSLQSVLANLNSDDDNADNPYDGDKIKPGKNKIYLGQAASYPETTTRYPFWLPVDLLSTHL